MGPSASTLAITNRIEWAAARRLAGFRGMVIHREPLRCGMVDAEGGQGIRSGPLVSSHILLLLSCILIQLSLDSDWASMSAEVEYTDEDRTISDLIGFELPDISMTASFGLTDMTTTASNDGEEIEETAKLEEINGGRETGQYLDMDWDEWYSTGKTTSIALWIGFIAAILGSVMALIGVYKANDTAHGSGIILCGLAASLINVGWVNWILFGGNFADEIPGGDGWKTDGFGVTTGFILCIIAGVFLLIVPFILAWSQELPINKLLPLKGGFAKLEMRHHQPSMRLNTTIVIMLICLLVFSGVGQGVASAYFEPDNSQNSAVNYDYDSDTEVSISYSDLPRIPWISFLLDHDVESGMEEQEWISLGDGETYDTLFFEDAELKPWQFFSIVFECNDDGNGETGAPNAQEETDILHWTIRTNNGQESSGSLDCNEGEEEREMPNDGNDDWANWFDELDLDLIYHDYDDADSVIETAPSNKNMFPISVEFTAETRGNTLGQNQDTELEFRINEQDSEGYCGVCKITFDIKYKTMMAPEQREPHRHYNGTS